MASSNEYPGRFQDLPEKRTLNISVKLPLQNARYHGVHKLILDRAIHQTAVEATGGAPQDWEIDTRLYDAEPTYEARLTGVGSEPLFHRLGGACMRKLGEEELVGVTQRDVSWHLDAPKSIQSPNLSE